MSCTNPIDFILQCVMPGPAFTQYKRTNQGGTSAQAAVGMLGSPEANLSFNMDYTDGVHRFYDPSIGATWLALGADGWAIQHANPNNSSGDVWDATSNKYSIYGFADGRTILATNRTAIGSNTYDAVLTVPRTAAGPSIAGDTLLMIEGHRTKGVAGDVYLNAYNAGNILLGFGGGRTLVNTGSIGGWHGDAQLETKANNSDYAISGYQSGSGGAAFLGRVNNTSAAFAVWNFNGAGSPGSITTDGNSTYYNASSDRRLKYNIADAGDAGAIIDALCVRQWDWKSTGAHEAFGFVAQEEYTVYAPAVTVGDDGVEIKTAWGRDDSKLVPLLVKEIQSLRRRLEAAGI